MDSRNKIMINTVEYKKPLISQNQNNKYEDKKNLNFKGPGLMGVSGLRWLNDSPAIGACAVDLGSMVIPRTAIEAKNRGPQSGIETMIREGASCLIHACIGLIGLGSAKLISGKLNNEYGVKAHNLFAGGNTINNMASLWQSSYGLKPKFFDKFVSNLQGLSGSEWKPVSDEVKASVVENLVKLSEKSNALSLATGGAKKQLSKEVKSLKNLVQAQITQNTGAQSSFVLNEIKDETGKVIHQKVSTSLSELIDNATGLSNVFKKQTSKRMAPFVKSLAKNKNAATIIGLAICSAICFAIQPVNRYLTKKRTGQDGFVGVENTQPDDSKGFKTLKNALGAAFALFSIATIGKPSELLQNVQFNSKIPSINHFKLVYGLTISSRFMAARDKNELRESVIKDTLGFTNWLILGGVVSKLTARALGGKELINNPLTQEGKKGVKYALNWLTKASVKSYDEVLMPKVKELTANGVIKPFKQLFNEADNATKSKIFKIAGSQLAGYLYSGLVLGVGISKLNIFITNKVQAKKKANNTDTENKQKVSNTNYLLKQNPANKSVFKDFK